MKVSIATLLRVTNFGAFLQAFGLQEFLRQSGSEPSFLDLERLPARLRRLRRTWADVRLVCDPFEFIGLLHSAPAVLTDTSHGTIFSVLTGARFGVLGPAQKNKLLSLVESTAELEAVFERPCAINPRRGSFGAPFNSFVANLRGCLAAPGQATPALASAEAAAV